MQPTIVTIIDTTELASVTVLIFNWNSGQLLSECLKHLLMQTVRPARVIVLDNASADPSVDALGLCSNVTLQRAGTNLGFAAGNNRILAECDSEFIALLNPDAFPEPVWLENLLRATLANPDVASFGSRQLNYANTEYLDGIGDSYHVSGLVWRERYGEKLQSTDFEPREIFSPCAAAALYRRQAVMDVGGFDEDFFCYKEDVDLAWRLRLYGWKTMYQPEAIAFHDRTSGESTTLNYIGIIRERLKINKFSSSQINELLSIDTLPTNSLAFGFE